MTDKEFEQEWKRYCDSKGDGAVTINVKDVAKHFAEWGSAHLTNKASKIANDDLQEHIDECWQTWISSDNNPIANGDLTKEEFEFYARHFAQWQRELMMKMLDAEKENTGIGLCEYDAGHENGRMELIETLRNKLINGDIEEAE